MTAPVFDEELAALEREMAEMAESIYKALLEAPTITYSESGGAFAKMMAESYRYVMARHTAWSPYAFGGWT